MFKRTHVPCVNLCLRDECKFLCYYDTPLSVKLNGSRFLYCKFKSLNIRKGYPATIGNPLFEHFNFFSLIPNNSHF